MTRPAPAWLLLALLLLHGAAPVQSAVWLPEAGEDCGHGPAAAAPAEAPPASRQATDSPDCCPAESGILCCQLSCAAVPGLLTLSAAPALTSRPEGARSHLPEFRSLRQPPPLPPPIG